jgi:hypothetical protein
MSVIQFGMSERKSAEITVVSYQVGKFIPVIDSPKVVLTDENNQINDLGMAGAGLPEIRGVYYIALQENGVIVRNITGDRVAVSSDDMVCVSQSNILVKGVVVLMENEPYHERDDNKGIMVKAVGYEEK